MSALEARAESVDRPVQLSVAGVAKRFGGVTAVQDISLDLRKGQILSIIGPNGAGKTSLLNMISGFYKPDSGRILLEGRDITRRKPSDVAALGIARTFQNIALFSGLTVLDNLMLAVTSGCAQACSAALSTGAWPSVRKSPIAKCARN